MDVRKFRSRKGTAFLLADWSDSVDLCSPHHSLYNTLKDNHKTFFTPYVPFYAVHCGKIVQKDSEITLWTLSGSHFWVSAVEVIIVK